MRNKANYKSTSLNFLVFVFLSLPVLNSCKKEEPVIPPININITAEKTEVRTYEIINLKTNGNLSAKYLATFGTIEIELLKTSDTTLTFYVPDVNEGEFTLNFDLVNIKFNVSKTQEVDANQLVAEMFQNFEIQVDVLNPTTTDELAEIDSLNSYKKEVLALFNSLSIDEKRQTALFYEANKDIFKSFSNSTFANLDAPTTKSKQSECPTTDFKSFYGCTATNLGDAAVGLKNSSIQFLKMMGMAGVMAGIAYNTSVLGPAAWGLTAVGISLPLGMAGYLLITEVRPAGLHFKHSLLPFLKANWIFSKALFQATTEVFQDQISTSLNLTPKFRSLTSNDGNVNSGSGYFISAMTSLREYWDKLKAIFGNFPTYNNTEEPTTLATNEISISNISNSNVQFQGNVGQSVKFKSLSGNEENFSYNIRVSKEGFVEEKTLTGKVLPATPIELTVSGISNNGEYDECYGGPLNMYYLSFNYIDPENKILNDLSNLRIAYIFENNGCIATWKTSNASNYFANYPITFNSTQINIPSAASLGDNNSNWVEFKAYFINDITGAIISNEVKFKVIRGVNYP
jgi:hypothetical protein